MPKVTLEYDLPNLDDEDGMFWSRWIQEICLWIPPSHWIMDSMGKTSGA